MKKSYRIFYFYLCFLFLVISSVSNYTVFANDGYKLEQTNQLSDVEKGVFVDAFMDNYKNIPTEKLNITYKNSSDVKKWLIDTFYEEKEYLEHNQNVYAVCAKILENNRTIGIAIFEALQNGEENIIHIRQIAILPEWQGKNIGTKIYFYIKNFVPNCDIIVVDTKKINSKAVQFYQRNGFKLMDTPYDRSLDSNKYCGFTLKLKR